MSTLSLSLKARSDVSGMNTEMGCVSLVLDIALVASNILLVSSVELMVSARRLACAVSSSFRRLLMSFFSLLICLRNLVLSRDLLSQF